MQIDLTTSSSIKKHLSFSEYKLWKECPHKWALSYLETITDLPISTSDSLFFGSVVHYCIEQTIANNIPQKDWRKLIESQWKKKTQETIDGGTLNALIKLTPQHKNQIINILTHLNFDKEFKDYEVLEIEHLLFEPLTEGEDPLLFKGFIDLVLQHKTTKKILLIDWKTANQNWNMDKKKEDKLFWEQLALYKHFYSVKMGIPLDQIETKYISLTRRDMPFVTHYKITYNEATIKTALDSFIVSANEVYQERIKRSNFTKAKEQKNLEACKWCDFKNTKYCP